MKNNILAKNSKYLFIGVFLIIAILSFLVIKSFITSILSSIVLSYLTYPIYKRLNNYIKNKSISALLIIFLLILIIFIPMFFAINSLFKESLFIYNYLKSNELILNPEISNLLNKIVQYIVNEASSLVVTIPKFLLHVFVTVFLLYYFLKEGENLVYEIKSLMPMDEKHKNKVVDDFKKVTHSIVYGVMFIGLIVGALSTIGFYIFKVQNPVLWGLITTIMSVLPGVGNWIVWFPAGIIKIIQGDLFNGIGLLIYGFILISGLEVILKLKFIGEKSNVHPALIVLGVFGGIQVLGFVGIFFGPLILIIFITFLKSILRKN